MSLDIQIGIQLRFDVNNVIETWIRAFGTLNSVS